MGKRVLPTSTKGRDNIGNCSARFKNENIVSPIMKARWISKCGKEADLNVLLETYKEYRNEKNVRYQMMMNETKFYVTMIAAILSLTATGAALILKREIHDPNVYALLCVIIFLILPIIAFYLSYTGIIHLKGSYTVYLEHISVLMKLENILGIDSEIKLIKCENELLEPTDSPLKNDKYIIPERWKNRRLNMHSTDDFINDVIKQPKSYYKIMRNVYILFIVISIVIILSGSYTIFHIHS